MDFDKHAAEYDKNFMGKGSARFYRDLISEINVNDGDTVLDVGCGTGTILHYIAQRKNITGYGMDVSDAMLDIAREKENTCAFISGDAGELPFEDNSTDIITACMAYHHFPNQKKFRDESFRVLKPGGRLYICDPRFPAPVRGLLNTLFKEAGFHSIAGNSSYFTETGFAVEKITKDAYVQVLCFRKPE